MEGEGRRYKLFIGVEAGMPALFQPNVTALHALIAQTPLFKMGAEITVEVWALPRAASQTEMQTSAAWPPSSYTAPPPRESETNAYTTSPWNTTNDVCWLDTNWNCVGVGVSCLCIPGFFLANATGECVPCPSGTYKSGYGFEGCVPCPDGLVGNTHEASTRCIPCPDGEGFYALPNASHCALCSGGRIPHSLRMTRDCLVLHCEGGHVPSADRRLCIPCPLHWFQTDESCVPCPYGGFTEAEASTDCLHQEETEPPTQQPACAQGFVHSADMQLCVPCPRHWFQSGEACVPCAKGEFTDAEGSTLCIPPPTCDPGYVHSTNMELCVPCSINWIQSGEACVPCADGEFTDAEGSTLCIPPPTCDPGYVLAVDMQLCTPCPQNWFQRGEACVPCADGEFTDAEGSTLCIPPPTCDPGYVLAADMQLCTPCPQNWTQSGEACVPCADGEYTDAEGSTLCISPPPTGAPVCDPGYVLAANMELCVPCSINWIQSGEACVPCASDEYTEAVGSTVCLEQSYPPKEDPSRPCPQEGYLLASDGELCVPCPTGWYLLASQNLCLQCAEGKFTDSEGSTTCTECAPGTYAGARASGVCEACRLGTYAPGAGHTACLDCGGGGLTVPPLGGIACATDLEHSCADEHYYFSTHVIMHSNRYRGCTPCRICEAETFTSTRCNGTMDSVCSACATCHSRRTTLARYCTIYEDSVCSPICLPGELEQGASCVVCPRGTMLGEGCIPCADGAYNDAEGATACKECTHPFAFPNGNKSACVQQCEQGAFLNLNSGNGKVYCELCTPGTFYYNEGCSPCPANTYAGGWGQLRCEPCSDGALALSGSSACTQQTCVAYPGGL